MNVHDRDLAELAQVHYGDGDYVVMKPGRYVLCAVSGVKIPLHALRYWDPVRQEAYAGPKEATERWRAVNGATP